MQISSETYTHCLIGLGSILNKLFKTILFSVCFALIFNIEVYAQDSVIVSKKDYQTILEGRAEPLIGKKSQPLFVINGIIVRDSIKIKSFRENYLGSVKKIIYLNQKQAFNKYGIRNKDGILLICTKNKRLIDFYQSP